MTELSDFKASEQVVIHTIAGGGAYWLQLIDAAIWLLSSNEQTREVEILLHHKRGRPFPLIRRTVSLVQLLWSPSRLVCAVQRRVKKKVETFRGAKKPNSTASSAASPDPESIYEKITNSNKGIVLQTDVGVIRLRKAGIPLLENFTSEIKAIIKTLRLWRQCYDQGRFNPQSLLHLGYRGVIIGDLVASSTLRRVPQSGGALKSAPRSELLSQLFEAVCITDYICSSIKSDDRFACVMISEPTYLDGLYQRILRFRGYPILEWQDYAIEYMLVYANQPLSNPMVVRGGGKSLSEFYRSRAELYMEERLENSAKHLYYMQVGVNRHKELLDTQGHLMPIDKDRFYAVVFLHSFDDAQYWYGVDGFDDIYHWTMFTIDILTRNPAIERILIKAHPNVDYEAYPGDRTALDRLKRRYGKEQKVVWVKADCGISALKGGGHFVGITHHGSVAEELAYAGVPVIGSAIAPWGDDFPFLATWHTPDEYQRLLECIPTSLLYQDADARESLYKFITQYRLNSVDRLRHHAWLVFIDFFGLNCPSGNVDLRAARIVQDRLQKWKPDSPEFTRFIGLLVRTRQQKVLMDAEPSGIL